MVGVGSPVSCRTKDASSNSTPVEADGASGEGRARFRSSVRRFDWASSSPAPAVVAALERRFPEVLQVPSQVLAEESEDWGMKAVIACNLSRWVPHEAIVRELRRAGAAGGIEALSLAHRHFMFRFADPDAKALALGRPWVVNGQPIAMENWRPELVPSDDSLSSVLLWIRLPSLPIEFWPEPIVSSILSAAGDFICLDAASRERKRGWFARGCVRVNLRKPLRPGVRVHGMSSPFWQPFVYEHLEGICSSCGSLHQGDGCGSVDETVSPSSPPLYGPWMAALRCPRNPNVKDPEVGSKPRKSPVSSSEDWQLPKKPVCRTTAGDGVTGVDASASAVRTGGVDRPSVILVVAKESVSIFSSTTASGNLSSLKASVEGGLACRSLVSVPVQAGGLREPMPALQKSSSVDPITDFDD